MNARTLIIARGVAVIGGTAALIAGATFAASDTWKDTATLSADQITSGTVDLQIAKPGDATWNDNEAGYSFKLKPGSSDPYVLRFNDAGDTNMALSLHIPSLNLHGIDPTKVLLHLSAGNTVGTDLLPAGTTLASAQGADVSAPTTLAPGVEQDFTLTLETQSGAITGQSGSSDHFDLVFTGTAAE